MHTIIPKLSRGSMLTAYHALVHTRERQGFAVVNYLYAANLTARKLFAKKKSDKYVRYHQALCESDLLLPDGIGLQLFAFLYFLRYQHKKLWLPNLNGTDFLPYVLQKLQKDYDLKLVLYGTKPAGIERSAKFLEDRGYEVVYRQDGFREFDWEAFVAAKTALSSSSKTMRVFVQGRTTVTNPIQELWTLEHMQQIREHGFVLLNQSGTFDHSVLGGQEKRAPRLVQLLKLEWLRRTIINPKKGRKKLIVTFGLIPLIFQKILLKKSS